MQRGRLDAGIPAAQVEESLLARRRSRIPATRSKVAVHETSAMAATKKTLVRGTFSLHLPWQDGLWGDMSAALVVRGHAMLDRQDLLMA